MSAPSIILLGATGTIGRATLSELRAQGHDVTCLVRQGSGDKLPDGAKFLEVDLGDPDAVARCMETRGGAAVVSCMASRTGRPADAWAVDYQANMNVLTAAQAVGCAHFILLSAICVQKPLLEFQRAKLAFEAALIASGLQWSIVRPTAFFKSLSGQVRRVQAGKPFLVFGDGTLTACTPISDRDLARYLVGCLNTPARMNRILPIGGPGPALTPRAQGEVLFDLLGKKPRFRQVPVALMDGIIATLSTLGRVNRGMAEKAEFARIGRYYATESMLVWNPTTARYDADATPAFGDDSLRAHYQRLLLGKGEAGLGDHAMF
ncbi:MAG: NAD-dependent epimerase/dehydratase family protein [Roseinatronobacter sp.]|nr:MAG: NAD-dependent epimerase/dehydratase family protein [Roseinatronobacter sp.]